VKKLILIINEGIVKIMNWFKPVDRLSSKNIERAVDIVESKGMKAHLYLASMGNRGDRELSEALDTLSSAGFIVTDSNGTLAGRVATKRLDSNQIALQRRAQFKVLD